MIGATALPAHSAYFDILINLGESGLVVGAIGLIAVAVWPNRQSPPASRSADLPSASIIARGTGSKYKIVDSVLGADSVIDDSGNTYLTFERSVHAPRPSSKRAPPDDKNQEPARKFWSHWHFAWWRRR